MRDITSGFQTEIEATQLRPIILLKAEFDSGDVRMWSGLNDLIYNSETYFGVGNFLSINGAEETNELRASSSSFRLSGIDPALLSISLLENYQGRPISCFFGVLDNNKSLIADPYMIFKGRMDIIQISDDGLNATVTVNAESDLVDLRVVREKKYTPEDQKSIYPNDLGLDFVPSIQDITVNWGVGVL
jgi:hypothetical protein